MRRGMAALHSLPFIEWNEATHKFVVNEDGARYLSTFDNKIGAAWAPRAVAALEVGLPSLFLPS